MKKILFGVLLALAGCGHAPDGPPNIILVTVDTLRWDYLAAYGYEDQDISPAAGYLADHGYVFDMATATAGTTVPSHGSMLTGVHARVHGARSNFHGLYPGVPAIAEALQAAGYRTGAFVSQQFLVKIGGLATGFEHTNVPFKNADNRHRGQSGDKTVGQAGDWLGQAGTSDPLFMWVHLWEPHGPYYASDWSRSRLGAYDGFLKDGALLDRSNHRVADIVSSPEHTKAMRTHYAGEVNLADQYLQLLLDDLQSRGLLSNSVVIFTADHGQALAENQRMGHGPVFWETVLRVPLIVADFRSGDSGRIATRVGTIDIAPTIADAAGLDIPGHYAGRSLLHPRGLEEGVPYFAEVELRTSDNRNWERVKGDRFYDPAAVAVYVDNMKLTSSKSGLSLYKTAPELLVATPLESAMEMVMSDYLQGLVESFQETGLDLTDGNVSPEDLEELKGLGYIQ